MAAATPSFGPRSAVSNPFHVPREHLTQHQACMKQWVMSGQIRWPHAPNAPAATAAPTPAQAFAAAPTYTAATGVYTHPVTHTVVRTPFFYSLFPAMWRQETPVHDCSRAPWRGGAGAETAATSTAATAARDTAAAANSALPVPPAVSVAAPPAPTLVLRPRSPSRVLQAQLGEEHRRRLQSAEFSTAIIGCTAHVSGNTVLPGPGDPMPGTGPISPGGGGPSPDGMGAAGLPPHTPPVPVLHRGSTRFSKPVADMGDYLGVIRHVRTLRNALADQWDDPAYQTHVAMSMAHQKQQQAAQQQQQQQLQAMAAQQQQDGRWGSADAINARALLSVPRQLHVDEADDALPPMPNGGGLGMSMGMGGVPPPLSPAMRRRRKAQERRGNQRMSWSQFLAARNGAAQAAAAAAASATPSTAAPMDETDDADTASANGGVRKREGGSDGTDRGEHKRARFDSASPLSFASSGSSSAASSRAGSPFSTPPGSPSLSAASSPSLPPLPAAAPPSPLLSTLLSALALPPSAAPASAPSAKAQQDSGGSSAAALSPDAATSSSSPTAEPLLLMLRYRLECDTGARELAMAGGGADASTAASSTLPLPPVAHLEQHLSRVVKWFSHDLAATRSSSPLPGASPATAPPRALAADYERLFYQYRADLQARFLTSQKHQQVLLQRMQWKAVQQPPAK